MFQSQSFSALCRIVHSVKSPANGDKVRGQSSAKGLLCDWSNCNGGQEREGKFTT